MEKEEKRPIYKKWWFWLIVIIVIAAIGSSGTSQNTSINTSANTIIDTKTNSMAKDKPKIVVVDFSEMTKEQIQVWCDENKVKANFGNEYSNTVEKGSYSSQKPNAGKTISENDTITINYSLGREPTLGEKNALKCAKNYLNTMAFSYQGLIKQLEFEGYSNEEAIYAVDNCGADWNEQAVKTAQSYLKYSSFSRNGLIGVTFGHASLKCVIAALTKRRITASSISVSTRVLTVVVPSPPKTLSMYAKAISVPNSKMILPLSGGTPRMLITLGLAMDCTNSW